MALTLQVFLTARVYRLPLQVQMNELDESLLSQHREFLDVEGFAQEISFSFRIFWIFSFFSFKLKFCVHSFFSHVFAYFSTTSCSFFLTFKNLIDVYNVSREHLCSTTPGFSEQVVMVAKLT